jgi:hypothetical protein
VEPGVPRHWALDGPEPTHDIAEDEEDRRQVVGLEAALVAARFARDENLVRHATRRRANSVHVLPVSHIESARLAAPVQFAVEVDDAVRPLSGHGGRRLPHPDELRVGVGEACTGQPAFVDQRVDVTEAFLASRPRAPAPGLGDELDLGVV